MEETDRARHSSVSISSRKSTPENLNSPSKRPRRAVLRITTADGAHHPPTSHTHFISYFEHPCDTTPWKQNPSDERSQLRFATTTAERPTDRNESRTSARPGPFPTSVQLKAGRTMTQPIARADSRVMRPFEHHGLTREEAFSTFQHRLPGQDAVPLPRPAASNRPGT